MKRTVALYVVAICVACGDPASPVDTEFTGTYRLTAYGNAALPATVTSVPATGASTRIVGGSLQFGPNDAVLTRSYEDRVSATAAPATRTGSDVFTAGRSGDRVFLISRIVPADTQATVTRSSSGSLLFTWRASGLQTLLFER